MARHHTPSLVAARPDTQVAILADDGLSVHANAEARLKRDDDHIGRDKSPLEITGLVRGEAHGATTMERQIVCFRRQRAVRTDKEQRIVDETIKRCDIAVELRLSQRWFQLFDGVLMHDFSDLLNRR
jgi:hypothetical protein